MNLRQKLDLNTNLCLNQKMKANTILLLENIHSSAEIRLQEAGFKTIHLPNALDENELIARLDGCAAIGIRSKTQITKNILNSSNCKNLQLIACFCIGTNQVDLIESKLKGIPTFNAPHSNTRSVAELVLAEIIFLSRQIFDRSILAHQGGWLKSAEGSHEIRGKTLGIIGYGHIGTQVSILAEAFGMKVIFYDIQKKLPLGNAMAANSIEEVLKQADFITLHVPSSPQTNNLLNKEALSLLKHGSYLLNLSRGDVVDLDYLAVLIKNKIIGGAAIDVFPIEPASNKEKFHNPLQNLPNVILTPHIGGSTEEAQQAIGSEVSQSIIEFFKRGQTIGAVGFPPLLLPPPQRGRFERIANVHRNRPGALGEINSLIAKMKVNIVGQALVTDSDIGYTLIDIEEGNSQNLVQEINAKSESTIKTWITGIT